MLSIINAIIEGLKRSRPMQTVPSTPPTIKLLTPDDLSGLKALTGAADRRVDPKREKTSATGTEGKPH